VTLSGIWNLYSTNANQRFGPIKLAEAKQLCWIPHLNEKSADYDVIVPPLLNMLSAGKKAMDLLEYTYILQHEYPAHIPAISVMQNILKHVVRPLTGAKKPSEADAMLIWGAMFKDGLPLDCRMSIHLGEQGCAATTLSKSMLAEVFETGNATRKCDCLLSVDGLDVGNFEAKRECASDQEVAVQLRKNAKINKSILLELE
ncbi:hypothetical protein BGX27_005227, partial [Mortierella sp. AM989]